MIRIRTTRAMARLAMFVSIAPIALYGCVGTVGGGGSGGSAKSQSLGLVTTITRTEWQSTPAGCEGKLSNDVHFAVAQDAPELVVATESDGTPLCVDGTAAVEAELDAMEDVTRSEGAHLMSRARVRYLLTIGHIEEIHPTSGAIGDPEPQPNAPIPETEPESEPEDDSSDVEDPEPQPNNEEAESSDSELDPEPQPNRTPPTGDTSTTSGSPAAATPPPPPPPPAPDPEPQPNAPDDEIDAADD